MQNPKPTPQFLEALTEWRQSNTLANRSNLIDQFLESPQFVLSMGVQAAGGQAQLKADQEINLVSITNASDESFFAAFSTEQRAAEFAKQMGGTPLQWLLLPAETIMDMATDDESDTTGIVIDAGQTDTVELRLWEIELLGGDELSIQHLVDVGIEYQLAKIPIDAAMILSLAGSLVAQNGQGERPEAALIDHHLALALCDLGQYSEAEGLFKHAQRILEQHEPKSELLPQIKEAQKNLHSRQR